MCNFMFVLNVIFYAATLACVWCAATLHCQGRLGSAIEILWANACFRVRQLVDIVTSKKPVQDDVNRPMADEDEEPAGQTDSGASSEKLD